MPTEDDLRNLFASADAPNTLDARRVIAKSRARRLPMQLGAGALGVLALAGVGVLAVQVSLIQSPSAVMTAEDTAVPEGGISDSEPGEITRAPVELLNPCGAPTAQVAPSPYGLELTVEFPGRVPAGAEHVEGVVRLTNTSDVTVAGTTPSAPAITVAQNGITVWRSTGVIDVSLVPVGLAPGESMEYAASFDAQRCGPQDEGPGGFRSSLPPLEAGDYELSAAIDFSPSEANGDQLVLLDRVTGPRSVITLD